MKIIVIYVVVFDPIKILIPWAHQNDHQNEPQFCENY